MEACVTQVHFILYALLLNFITNISRSNTTLLYPPGTVFQIIGSLSVPISDLQENRKILFDWGFQMNHDMPSNLSQLYMIPIWPHEHLLNDAKMLKVHPQNQKQVSTERVRVHRNDYHFIEFYHAVENALESYDIQKSCLLRHICNISQQPFDRSHGNFLSDILEFILRPSALVGMESSSLYHVAELKGFLGYNCGDLYSKCLKNILAAITRIL